MQLIHGRLKLAIVGGLLALSIGCASDDRYNRERPPVDQLTRGNEGLQAKDVVSATDQMANDLLLVPELNASKTQWTMVITDVANHTTDPEFSYGAFNARLRSKLAQLGHGRVALIENRATYKNIQNKELEQQGDEFGQGGGKTQPGPVGQNPDYGLYITVDEMPNRATNYYLITATATNLGTRQQVWVSNPYEVQTRR